MAEAWLTAQEPFIRSNELGGSVDEVEQLIRRHEAFRKAAATWEERFSSLRRLTTVTSSSASVIVTVDATLPWLIHSFVFLSHSPGRKVESRAK